MTKNPCLNGRTPEEIICPHMLQDKNLEPCPECDDRVRYGVAQGDLSPELLEEKKERVVEVKKERKRKCIDCGSTDKPIKAWGRCRNCYGTWKLKNPEKVRPYNKKGIEREEGKCL